MKDEERQFPVVPPVTCFVLLLVSIAVAPAGFFDLAQVNDIRITFPMANWDEILDSLYSGGDEARLVGSAVVNGQRFDSVGVRYKGHSSYNPSRRKNPLNIKLDFFKPGQNIEGHGTVRLANVYKDPSFVREVLSYEIARRYMPAGGSNYATVYVNDTLLGLYTNDEDVDKQSMRRFFYCADNARFKGQMTDSAPMQGWKYLGPDSVPYREYFELESNAGWGELVCFLDVVNRHPAAVDGVLNTDRHLWMLAFDVLMVNLDAPINTAQNYYLYRDAAARFNPIVWDLNENFGAYRDLEGFGQLSVTQMQQLDPFLRANDTSYPILSRFLVDSRLRRMYVAHMKTIIAETFAGNWYRDRALEIQDLIDARVRADPNKFYTYNDFLNNITRSVGTGPLAIVGLTELMGARISFLLNRPEFQAAAPVVERIEAVPNRARPNSDVQFLARVTGADSVFLGVRADPAGRFCRLTLLDDGQHGDSSAGDGLFGGAVRVGAGDVEYYVYAENPAAAAFFPVRAEHEYLTLPVTGDVVINELMAVNVSTVRDPSGEYDDWIEIRNNSASRAQLDGFFLSDDSTRRLRWEFPDIAVPAFGYVLVWADSDLAQPGLHANFRLSGSGEHLVLSDPDGIVVDRVVFGPLQADAGFGRYPDGTGGFRFMNPTPGSANDSALGVSERVGGWALNPVRAAPNPFRGVTLLRYQLPVGGHVTLRVFDASGRLLTVLVDREQLPGGYAAGFRTAGQPVPGGVYFAHLAVRTADGGRLSAVEKLVLAE